MPSIWRSRSETHALTLFSERSKNMDTVPDGNRIPVHLCEINNQGMFFAVG